MAGTRVSKIFSLTAFIALGALGAMLTDQVWFWTATRGSAWLMDVYCRLTRRARGCIDDSVAGLARYGPLSVILGRFFTVVRVVTWPMLVRNGLGWPRFAALDAVGAVVWSAIWVGLGWIVRRSVAGRGAVRERLAADRGRRVRRRPGGPLALRAWRRRARERSAH